MDRAVGALEMLGSVQGPMDHRLLSCTGQEMPPEVSAKVGTFIEMSTPFQVFIYWKHDKVKWICSVLPDSLWSHGL